jgi:CheY-like chemotaxis protein
VPIYFLTSDLVFPSRVAGVAQQLGDKLETANSSDALIAKLSGASSPGAVVLLDLNSPGVDPAAIVPRLKALPQPPQAIIAFGPHVHEQKLAAASAAGCDVVLTRGQFDAQMRDLLARFSKSTDSE